MNNELYHSGTYRGVDFSDGLYHWKYVDRYKGKNGKWVYVYDKVKKWAGADQKAEYDKAKSEAFKTTHARNEDEMKVSGARALNETYKSAEKRYKQYQDSTTLYMNKDGSKATNRFKSGDAYEKYSNAKKQDEKINSQYDKIDNAVRNYNKAKNDYEKTLMGKAEFASEAVKKRISNGQKRLSSLFSKLTSRK